MSKNIQLGIIINVDEQDKFGSLVITDLNQNFRHIKLPRAQYTLYDKTTEEVEKYVSTYLQNNVKLQ